jgi:hypothetical protein
MKKSNRTSVVKTIVKRQQRAKTVSLLAKYDKKSIKLTDGFVKAIEQLMEEECKMMQQNKPQYAYCWTWGICRVRDLADADGLKFEFGGEPDKPQILKDHKKQFMVLS